MVSKEQNVEKMEAQIREWGTAIESLMAMGEAAGDHVRADYHRRVEELKVLRVEAHTRLDAFKAAGTETWEAFRTGIEAVWKDIETTLKDTPPAAASPKPPRKAAGRRPPQSTSRPQASVQRQPPRHRGNSR